MLGVETFGDQRRPHDVQPPQRPQLLVRAGFECDPHPHLRQLPGGARKETRLSGITVQPVEVLGDHL
jgi:hypothetical protein